MNGKIVQRSGPSLYPSLAYEIAFFIDRCRRGPFSDCGLRQSCDDIAQLVDTLALKVLQAAERNDVPFDYWFATYLDKRGASIEGTALFFDDRKYSEQTDSTLSWTLIIKKIYSSILRSEFVAEWHGVVKPYVDRRCVEVSTWFETHEWSVLVDTLRQLGFTVRDRVKEVYLVTEAVNHAMKLPSGAVILDPGRDNAVVIRLLIHECLHPPVRHDVLSDALLGLDLAGPVISAFLTYRKHPEPTYPHIGAFVEEALVRAIEDALYAITDLAIPLPRWNDTLFEPVVSVLRRKILAGPSVEESFIQAVHEGVL